jgi:CRISP-associated protein Cas1
MTTPDEDSDLLSVMSLHALVYCERLFYLEEVEKIRVADARVYAGRRLHEEIAQEEDEVEGSVEKRSFESTLLGIRGQVDVIRRRDGRVIAYEHKRGRSAGKAGAREAWETDRVQVAAYAMLLEEAQACEVVEGRVRYHADRVTVRVPLDAELRNKVTLSIARARLLRETIERPPICDNERLCNRCSLAPVCLPEEARLGNDPEFKPIRLLPEHPDGQTLHVVEPGATVGRSGNELLVRVPDGKTVRVPTANVGQVVIHGYAQITTQAIRLCVDREIGVSWVTQGGGIVGALTAPTSSAQRQLRQFSALVERPVALELSRRLVVAKIDSQLRYLLRASRSDEEREAPVTRAVQILRDSLSRVASATDIPSLLGYEGTAAAAYFGVFDKLLDSELGPAFAFSTRNRRPPKDRVNAVLSFAYGMLYREVLAAIIAVGLHPGMGFYHQPRSSAQTLALDLMELFRVPLVDMPVVAALNRRTFDETADFTVYPNQVLLSDSGRKKAIEVFERRREDTWRHSVVGYSISYARMVELEVRLLEKEWTNEGGLFARFRLR